MLRVIESLRMKEQDQMVVLKEFSARELDLQATIKELEFRIAKTNLVMSKPHRNLTEESDSDYICEMAVQTLQTQPSEAADPHEAELFEKLSSGATTRVFEKGEKVEK
jgi:hypothetical protein